MPSSTAAAGNSSSTTSSTPSPVASAKLLSAAKAPGPVSVAAAVDSELPPAMATTTAPAIPPGFGEYILAQKVAPVDPAAARLGVVPPTDPVVKPALPVVDDGEVADDDGLREGLDGFASQWGKLPLKHDVEGGTFAFTQEQSNPAVGYEQQPEFFLRLDLALVDEIGGPVLLIGLLIDGKHHNLGSLQLAMAQSCTWCVCSDWFWYNDGFDIMASELEPSSTSKRCRGEENSSHEDGSTELN